ncbi:DUF6766 family protein [Curtobacterium sp. UNCCL20]|uniref:DUF6766 family protein n=1 Tax=Curtobacterium sp. UNCCL20 TaxID=1502773 RepID=UPI0015874F19|nr:DUF6766 family protein [Curtobacterium sp. UNCCL20]
MRMFVRQNSLSLFFGAIFLAALVGQSFAGWASFNDTQVSEGLATIGYGEYVTSSSFAADVAENWQSEYLQFLLYIWATVWFVQRGSPESKESGQVGTESDRDQEVGGFAGPGAPSWARARGPRRAVFSHSLLIVMGTIFLLSWLAQSVAGVVAFNEEQLASLEAPLTWGQYLFGSDFWNRTLQNWQSEFLAVGSMAVLSVYLRERGSPESKPVGARHDDTGAEG